MGSQTLEILRQGVWASLTGGWFYDPHQNVFCNAVHLYIWLFLLCAPFITYLYFPKTFTTWGVYCLTTTFTITVLKIINMALHILYDKAQNFPDSTLKKPLKDLKENLGEDECGIEMQVLGGMTLQPTEQPMDEISGANSMISIDCQDQIASTIDFKVDVHRKNSSESSESVELCPTNNMPPLPHHADRSKRSSHRRSLKVKSKSEERPRNLTISEELTSQESKNNFETRVANVRCGGELNKGMKAGDKRKNYLERQSSFDVSEASVLEVSLAKQQSIHVCCDADIDNFSASMNKRGNHKSTKLQRHRSSESNDERRRRNRNLFLNHREQQSGADIHNQLQSVSSNLYLESNYAKSDLGIERIESNSKMYLLQQTKPMRKDSNSTMSALQLPVASSQPNNIQKRRHSNTGCSKPICNQAHTVRRIKSAALEISCSQPSVSNLSPHPNSAEAISGQQIKNPQNAILPPPSKCLVRNPHLNLCPKLNNMGNNSSGIIVEPVYPIAEQADEKSLNDPHSSPKDLEGENLDKLTTFQRKRFSTTESESDLERPRTQSTDSETDNNGSRSPLLNKINQQYDKYKSLPEEQKIISSVSNFSNMANNDNLISQYKNGDSGCPSSDCEQTSASSKDMLLSKETNGENDNKRWSRSSEKGVEGNVMHYTESSSQDVFLKENEIVGKKANKDAKYLGAIPKTSSFRKEDLNDNAIQKQALAVIPKSNSRNSSSASSCSFSAESVSNDIYKSYKDQWLIIGANGHNQSIQSTNTTGCMHSDVLFSNYSRRTFIDTNYKFQPKLRHSSDNTKRKDIENDGCSKLDDITAALDFVNDELQNTRNGSLSIQGLMNEHFEQRPSTGHILNINHVEFNDTVCCDYWRPCLTSEKPIQPKRFYKYQLQFFGHHELKISMDRLQLLALFDRDLQWFHVIIAIILSTSVCVLGSIILQMGFYKDIFAFLFCVVIAGSHYSLLKSAQPDAASPIHGFNKTVAYSRPIYFCLCSSLLLLSHHLAAELNSNEKWNIQQEGVLIFGIQFIPQGFLQIVTKVMSIVLLFLPVFFSLGLFPQINTFCMYILEQIDMHIFGASAACSLLASIICVLKSVLAVCLLYGPVYGGLIERKGTQHTLFSIFCALLFPTAYHLSRTASDFTHIWAILKLSIISYPEDDEEDKSSGIINYQTDKDIKLESSNQNKSKEVERNGNIKENSVESEGKNESTPVEVESPDPLPKKLQQTVNIRLKNDLVVCSVLALVIFGLHCSTIFTVLQPDLNIVLYSIAGFLGFLLHYIIPQMRKHLPWLCFSKPILKQHEFGRFEVSEAAKIMWFEIVYVCLSFLERNVLYPLIFISTLTADSVVIVEKFGISLGSAIISICALKCVRSAYSDVANQYLILIFSVLLLKIDFSYASETFLIDYFVVSVLFRKSCDFLLKGRKVEFKIAPIPKNAEPSSWIKTSVEEVIHHVVQGLHPNDQVGITFCGQSFKEKGPGWLNYRDVSTLKVKDVWEMISKNFQSNSEGISTDTFCLGVTSVRLPEGKGNDRARKYNTFNEECAMRRGIVVINNKDNLCLVRALVVAMSNANKEIEYKNVRRDIGKIQTKRVADLLTESKVIIPSEGAGIHELQQFQVFLKEHKIVVYQYGGKGRDVIFEGQNDAPKLNLLYHNNHYNVITSLTAAFCSNYYCEDCHVPYNAKKNHRCGGSCPCCQQSPACTKNLIDILCSDCNRNFRGQKCFDNHKTNGSLNRKTICEQIKRCMDCLKTYKSDNIHVCGDYFCKTCVKHVAPGHLCYINTDNRKPTMKDTLSIFYDLETRQEKVIGAKYDEEQEIGEIKQHEPNLCVSAKRCDLCIEDKNLYFCQKCGYRIQIYKNHVVKNFINDIMQARKKFKKIIVMAHNGQAFDHQFILNYVLNETDVKPNLIMRGTKLIMMLMDNVKFIDSLNYFPMALSKLPKAFDLPPVYKKGYFPQLFNTLENENYVGTLPPIKYYSPDTMKTEDRDSFRKWYDDHKNDEFDMQRDLVDYCISDVQILAQACLKFRKLMLEECNVDPFIEATTIASACNLVYRRNYLHPDTIGIIPRNGYRNCDNQSKIALQWLTWEEDQRRTNILHSAKQKEVVLNGVKVDGYCPETNQVFEFHGCYYHGHAKCLTHNRDVPLYDDPNDT